MVEELQLQRINPQPYKTQRGGGGLPPRREHWGWEGGALLLCWAVPSSWQSLSWSRYENPLCGLG